MSMLIKDEKINYNYKANWLSVHPELKKISKLMLRLQLSAPNFGNAFVGRMTNMNYLFFEVAIK